ncbi:MAG: dihydropteroate synthase [Acidobacteria bacterium]|nr:MAG: dihydropteroate synthase [Acidobacteriota bacterium]
MSRSWHIRDHELPIGERTLIMGVLNITPDSFSDGGKFLSPNKALEHANQMIDDGADIIDVGGESTRPGSEGPVSAEDEITRVVPVIQELVKNSRVPISVDTTKSEVATAALAAGAAIVNDISALRFDFYVADAVAKADAGLVLMHSRGTPATMHRLPPVADIMKEVTSSLGASIKMAMRRGVKQEAIVVDPGIGFGKSQEQNLELIAKLDKIIAAFPDLPVLVGTSRKSFIGRVLSVDNLNPAPPDERLHGTMATVTAAILAGAHIVRVHDVKAAVETVRVADALRSIA